MVEYASHTTIQPKLGILELQWPVNW